ncbi:ABC transporter permease [Halobellus sp. H-GB7]|uniref:ABC transporter permease n=1 Tax=Halobellus sp. H-GB7 TaxID=3069756 RepID=UPI0027B2F365|nr:ABC transporter permease [Halobellus sp. H-GB7]MDQ2055921.1 ABC transporter permease [Halobellus sp. H-GB7]
MTPEALFAQLLAHIDATVLKGLFQVGAAVAIALLVVGVSRVRGLALEREFSIALVRGFIQVLVMGSLIGVLLSVQYFWSWIILIGMIGGATWISKNRGDGLPGVTRVSFLAISFGAGIVIVAMTLIGAIESTVRDLVPIGSMIIANAMKINSLALDRIRGEVISNRDEIEAGLALGAPPSSVVTRHIQTGVRAALIPTIDSLKSLGWVWIPGIMTGMILSGENPLYAGLYQFVIMAMIFAAGGLTSMSSSLLISEHLFTDAEQLKQIKSDEGSADAIE